jgi:hypothetical protein
MRARPISPSPLYPKIRFAFTDHSLTVWAGAILLRLYFELLVLRTALGPILFPFTKRAPIRFRPGFPARLVLGPRPGHRAI